jgi:D-lactate dehydrogenase
MKIVIFEVESRELALFSSLGSAAELRFVAEPLEAANVHGFSDAELISIFIYSDLSRGSSNGFHP